MDKAIQLIEARIENIERSLDSMSFEGYLLNSAIKVELQTLVMVLKVEQALERIGA